MYNNLVRFIVIAIFSAFILTGCETTEGFGRDLKKVGGEIEEKADK